MSRLNVYVPDELASAARDAGLNVSALTQEAISGALARRATSAWLDGISGSKRRVLHVDAMAALDEAREELGG